MKTSPPQTVALTSTAYKEARNFIESKRKILILPHANVDPDGLSAALSCYLLFTDLGKKCTVVCPETPPKSLSFLPGFHKLTEEIDTVQDFIITLDCSRGVEVEKLRYSIEENGVNIIVSPKHGSLSAADIIFRESPPPYDLIVVVDTAELSLLGSLSKTHGGLLAQIPILNIDHHVSNTGYGQVQLIDTSAASATEVLYEWFTAEEDWQQHITPDIATLLLTGLITDTRSFQNPNTTPRSLEVAAELLDRGARQQEIVRCIYKTKPLSTLKIWGRALNNIQSNPRERIVWSTISKDDLQEMHSTSRETHGIIDDLLTTIPEADVYILFTELEEGGLKASVRSTESIDVSTIAAQLYRGGGHARAAGFRIRSYDNFHLQVLECVQKFSEAMRKQREHGLAQTPSPGETSPPSEIQQVQKVQSNKKTLDVLSSLAPRVPGKGARPGIDVIKEVTGGEIPRKGEK